MSKVIIKNDVASALVRIAIYIPLFFAAVGVSFGYPPSCKYGTEYHEELDPMEPAFNVACYNCHAGATATHL